MAKVLEVARATSAAPRYFSKQAIDEKTFEDGGVGCNNPSERIYSEIRAVHGSIPALILSIGAGLETETSTTLKGSKKHKILDHPRSLFKTVSTLKHIVTDSEEIHGMLQQDCHYARSDNKYPMYFRFNVPDIASKVDLDAWTASKEMKLPNGEKTLEYLDEETKAYLASDDVADRLQKCAIEIVRVRRERAETERWERFATHTVYQCPWKGRCGSSQFSSREKLRMHASERHEIVQRIMIDGRSVCLIEHCMETPRLHDDDTGFIKHLKDSDHHDMKDPKPMSTSQLEDWLDGGRQTEDMISEQMEQDRGQPNVTPRQPSPASDSGGRRWRKAVIPGRKSCASSTPSEQNVSTSDSQ
jgi:hypothetical protein